MWKQFFFEVAVLFLAVPFIISLSSVRACAAFGDQLKSFTPSPSGNGRAIAFDPVTGRLFYTITSSTNIFITDANNAPSSSINPGVLCGALAWDAKRHTLWCGAYDGSGDVYTINPGTGVKTFVFTFATTDSCYGPSGDKSYDGLAYDEGPTSGDIDDSLWLSGDAARTLYHVDLSGNEIASFTVPIHPRSGTTGCNTGIAVDGQFLWLALQAGPNKQPHDIVQVAKTNPTEVLSSFAFSNIDRLLPEDLELDTVTIPGVLGLWSNDATATSNQLRLWQIGLPPNVSQAHPSVSTLWPPNHKMVAVSILGVTDPDGDPITIRIDRIMQDEPVNGLGSGDTCPDAQGIGTSAAQLRAERSGTGNGRVYTVFFTATDGRGGSTPGSVKVSVPHDQSHSAVDDGPLFDSTVCL